MRRILLIIVFVFSAGSSGLVLTAFAQDIIVNPLGMRLVYIEPGTFMMGSEEDKESVRGTFVLNRQRPVHQVSITEPFYLGQYEVTQEQWEQVMGTNPSFFTGKDRPVEQVSWNEANSFIDSLNALEGVTVYRLPTEAEWEYAARAGSEMRYAGTNSPDEVCLYANVADSTERTVHPEWEGWDARTLSCDDGNVGTAPVGSLLPNAWDLYDMTGNVWEWVHDLYSASYYGESPERNPQGPVTGTHHVKRGGCWTDTERFLPVWFRIGDSPNVRRGNMLGFRVLRMVEE